MDAEARAIRKLRLAPHLAKLEAVLELTVVAEAALGRHEELQSAQSEKPEASSTHELMEACEAALQAKCVAGRIAVPPLTDTVAPC